MAEQEITRRGFFRAVAEAAAAGLTALTVAETANASSLKGSSDSSEGLKSRSDIQVKGEPCANYGKFEHGACYGTGVGDKGCDFYEKLLLEQYETPGDAAKSRRLHETQFKLTPSRDRRYWTNPDPVV